MDKSRRKTQCPAQADLLQWAWLVLNLYLGWEGTQPCGYPEAAPPIWGPSLCSLPCVGFCCCWLLRLQDQQPLLCPQATPLLLLCCFRDKEGTQLFSWSGEGRKDPADLQLCCSLSFLPTAFLAKPRRLLPALGDPLTDIWTGSVPIAAGGVVGQALGVRVGLILVWLHGQKCSEAWGWGDCAVPLI